MVRPSPFLLSLALACSARLASAAPGDHVAKCGASFDCNADCQVNVGCYLACVAPSLFSRPALYMRMTMCA